MNYIARDGKVTRKTRKQTSSLSDYIFIFAEVARVYGVPLSTNFVDSRV